MHIWHKACVWFWVAFCLFSLHARGKELLLDKNPTDRMRFHAIPVAISSMYHGWPRDYTGIKSLATYFQATPGPLDNLIHWAVAYQPPPNDDTYYWAADDRGMADYVVLSFRLFGPHLSSLYLFFFAFLALSCLLFLLEAGNSPEMSILLIFTLAAMYCSLGVIPLANLSPAAFDPVTIYEPRSIELLSFVPALHLAFAGVVNRVWTKRRIGLAALQALLLVWCYQARSSMGWQVLFIVLVSVVHMAWSFLFARPAAQQTASSRGFRRPGVVPLLLVVVAFTGLVTYERLIYNPRYFKEWGARVVWHNALMAIGSDAELGQKYKLSVNDADSITAVIAYLRETKDPRATDQWTTQNFLNSFGGHGVLDWSMYDTAARELYFQIWRENPRGMLRLYLLEKPQEILSNFYGASRLNPMVQRNVHDLYFNPLSAGALLLAFPGFMLVCASRARLGVFAAGLAALFLLALVPGFLFYSVVLTMMGAFVSLAVLAYLLIAIACSLAIRNAV